ncbi:hypothetical protein KM043_016872 [Ampulex compressa]|nr:hypothetical protein KM043_016872 [Ampulex compressa]
MSDIKGGPLWGPQGVTRNLTESVGSPHHVVDERVALGIGTGRTNESLEETVAGEGGWSPVVAAATCQAKESPWKSLPVEEVRRGAEGKNREALENVKNSQNPPGYFGAARRSLPLETLRPFRPCG